MSTDGIENRQSNITSCCTSAGGNVDFGIDASRARHVNLSVRRRNPRTMKQSIGLVSLVVPEYDEAIAFYVGVLGFNLVEDSFIPEQNKRWVVVAPTGSTETKLLLARAYNQEQSSRVGNQTGGRVFLFLYTDNFARDYGAFKARGVVFVREPMQQAYGTVAVFRDPWGKIGRAHV